MTNFSIFYLIFRFWRAGNSSNRSASRFCAICQYKWPGIFDGEPVCDRKHDFPKYSKINVSVFLIHDEIHQLYMNWKSGKPTLILFLVTLLQEKSIYFTKPWYDPMVNTVVLPWAVRLKHTRKCSFQNWHQKNIVYQKHTVLVKNLTSQKYGQIVPTSCGSILPHTKPSQLPYNAQNRFFGDIGHI